MADALYTLALIVVGAWIAFLVMSERLRQAEQRRGWEGRKNG